MNTIHVATTETMHELSIAMGIVDMAQEEGERRNAQITAVHIRLGLLSGVVKDALFSSYEMACDFKGRGW